MLVRYYIIKELVTIILFFLDGQNSLNLSQVMTALKVCPPIYLAMVLVCVCVWEREGCRKGKLNVISIYYLENPSAQVEDRELYI